jgi:hypothetical protein
MGFTARFTPTEDEQEWLGTAQVFHIGDEGGRALGAIYSGSEPVLFESCWNDKGNTVWMDADEGIADSGKPSNCMVDDNF